MHHSWQAAVFLISIFLIPFCTRQKSADITRSYYYWRSSGDISQAEKKFLRDHQINKLYVRLMGR